MRHNLPLGRHAALRCCTHDISAGEPPEWLCGYQSVPWNTRHAKTKAKRENCMLRVQRVAASIRLSNELGSIFRERARACFGGRGGGSARSIDLRYKLINLRATI